MTDKWAEKVLEGVPYNIHYAAEGDGICETKQYAEADVIAAITRISAGDGLVQRATAALEGVTPGPWSVPGQPDKICAEGYTRNGMAKTIATVTTPAWMGDAEPWANACFMAFTRQWVPEAAAHVATLTAERDALRERVARLEEALRECHDALRDHAKMYPHMVKGFTHDAEKRAAAALAKIKEPQT